MKVPDTFHFSQASLQDYRDCPRRFKLKYLQKLAWPAVEAEPYIDYEESLERGIIFHRLIHQHITGIPEERLSEMAGDEDLKKWWKNYLSFIPYEGELYPEIVLSAKVHGYTIIAKYDLICIEKEKALIIDWKTSRKKPSELWLSERLQTKVYPFLLSLAGGHLIKNKMFDPQDISMLYWFSNFPKEPVLFSYNSHKINEGRESVLALIDNIIKDKDYRMTDDIKHCKFCVYRSLCNRGNCAGLIEDMEEDEFEPAEEEEFDFDFDQIGEIEF